MGSLSRGVKIALLFQVGLPCYLRLNSGRPVSINVNKTRKHFSRNTQDARMFPQCSPVSQMVSTVSSVTFCFQDANCAYASRQGILTKIRACENLQKLGEHEQASTCVIFASNSSKGQIFDHFQTGWDHSIPLLVTVWKSVYLDFIYLTSRLADFLSVRLTT